MDNNSLSFIPLGGVGDVTKNMYVYEYKNEILVIDCGLGFADETMLGVSLLLPDISYLKKAVKEGKKIVGMAITHGHEDHLGALPFVLPDLPSFPVYATPLTAELANSKLKEFGINQRVQKVEFGGGELKIGSFTLEFIRITHSVPDSSNIFIKTPAGNFYHGSDFKFDLTPYDGKKTEYGKIAKASKEGILCLMSDCLRSEKKGHTPSESALTQAFAKALERTSGKFIVTTYSSNVSRVNQIIQVAQKAGRKVCFVGRSVIKAKEIAQNLGYIKIEKGMEISVEQLKNYKDSQIVLVVAGSQGQENSALSRIVNGDSREIKIRRDDTVVFSADPIPGNEVSINNLIDSIAKLGANFIYSETSDDFHVSGHAASEDLMLMMNLTNPKKVLPIGGTYRQMVEYRKLANRQGFGDQDILLLEDGQEVIFSNGQSRPGKKVRLENVYVDEISGEEVESFVLRDREKLAKQGVVVILAEIDANTGQMENNPDIVLRGLSVQETKELNRNLVKEIRKALVQKKHPVNDWLYMRKFIGEAAARYINKSLHKNPLILPVVIEI